MAVYNGSIELISGIKQANNGDFALVDASAVHVSDDGKRLNTVLSELNTKLNNVAVNVDETELRAMLTEILV